MGDNGQKGLRYDHANEISTLEEVVDGEKDGFNTYTIFAAHSCSALYPFTSSVLLKVQSVHTTRKLFKPLKGILRQAHLTSKYILGL